MCSISSMVETGITRITRLADRLRAAELTQSELRSKPEKRTYFELRTASWSEKAFTNRSQFALRISSPFGLRSQFELPLVPPLAVLKV